MKMSMRKMLVVLAIVLSFTAVQAVWAAEIEVTGTIVRIGAGETGSIDVASNGLSYTFYDIPFSDLATQGIVLNVGDSVTVYAYVVIFPNGKVKNIAYSITYGSVTYTWHPNIPKVGSTANSGTETTTLSDTGNCVCKCTDEPNYECHCFCGNPGFNQ